MNQDQINEIVAEVQAEYPKLNWPEPTLEPVWFGRRPENLIPGSKAIVNTKDGEVFGVCTDMYKILRHEVCIHILKEALQTVDGFGEAQVCPSLMSGGAKLKVAVKFPGCEYILKPGTHEFFKSDVIIPKMDVFSSYDLSWKFGGRWGAFQQTCSNGAGVWKTFVNYAKRHLQSLMPTDIRDSITEGMSVFTDQVDMWKKWTETFITREVYDNTWEALPFSAKEKEKIEALPQTGTTFRLEDLRGRDVLGLDLWTFNSILTQFATHEVKSELRRVDLEPQIAKAIEMTYNKVR